MTPFLCVFAAVNSATTRASAKSGIPIALISVAMDVDVAIAALNKVGYGKGYGSARAKAKGSLAIAVEEGWNDWRLLPAASNVVTPQATARTFAEGWMSVPLGNKDIVAFARRLEGLLRPRNLDASPLTSPIVVPRYVPTRNGVRGARVEDLYRVDPASDGDWLARVVEKAVDDARDEETAMPRRGRRPEKGA